MFRIGITAGDPAGVGFEVIFKAIPALLSEAQWVLFANRSDFLANRERFARSVPFEETAGLARNDTRGLWFQDTGQAGLASGWGTSTLETGKRAVAALEFAGRQALAGELDGIVTAPVAKRFAGSEFIGQTEFLARQAGRDQFAMSFFAPTFKVVLATTHLALAQVPGRLSIRLYSELIRLIDTEMALLGLPAPRIGVAALNPHAGEDGRFGHEDRDILEPAVAQARTEGLNVSGPHPADSLYLRAHQGEFDVVLAAYHDQGLIPVKLIAPGASTNVTLGLPYVRTSPDHGTALEIAGKGVADFAGMSSACRLAIELVRRRKGDVPRAG